MEEVSLSSQPTWAPPPKRQPGNARDRRDGCFKETKGKDVMNNFLLQRAMEIGAIPDKSKEQQ